VDLAGATSLAPMLQQQDPVLNAYDFPAATARRVGEGGVVVIPGPVFRNYHASHYPRLRRFVGDCFNALETPGLVRLEGPWYIEMSARTKDDRTLIQFVNRSSGGHLAPNRHMVEHVPDAGGFTVRVPMTERPTKCFMAPDPVGVDWTWKDGILEARVAGLHIHNVLVIE
jgi:hypothetical protein